ncbi:MAG: AAA family ATPase [Burkholderiaceae bacterium]
MKERGKGKLVFVCGKMAAGKSTLSKELAAQEDTLLLEQDELLMALFPEEIVDLASFVKYSTRVQDALAPHICCLLAKGISVVLDFPANTKRQRVWFRQLIERADAEHELHLIVASDDLCKLQLKQRSAQRGLPPGTKWTTEADFDEVTAYFDPPAADERFNVIRHDHHE